MHRIQAKQLLSAGNGMNLYRGCTHGCIYCDSRSKCYGFTHEFTDIAVKENAPELLRAALKKKRRRCMIGTGSMCDPYLHAEAELQLTRRCLEIIAEQGFGVSLLTKSDLVLRDLDLIQQIHENAKAVVQLTLTTADPQLCRILEPNVCSTQRRAEVLQILKSRGIPSVVWLCPLLPFLNDTEENLREILRICADAGVYGVMNFGMGLTLREGSREYFYAALDRHFPGLKARYMQRYGEAYELPSPHAARLQRIFEETCDAAGMVHDADELFRYLNEFPEPCTQFSLFDA